MKNIIYIFVFTAGSALQLAAGDPVTEKCCPVVVSSPEVDFSYDVDSYAKHFSPAYFNNETNALHFESFSKINAIEIFDENGKLQFKLPVLSNKVRISRNMFAKGDYSVSFDLEGQNDKLVAYVTIN